MIIKTLDGTFKISKSFLCARSPVLKEMLSHEGEVSFDCKNEVLEYLWSGKISHNTLTK